MDVAPRSPAYASNENVTVTATASNGWDFMYWAGDFTSTNPVVQVSMDRSWTLEAVFGTDLATGVPFGGGTVGEAHRAARAGGKRGAVMTEREAGGRFVRFRGN